MDLVDRLHQRAASYRAGGPSAEHTAALLDEAAVAISSAEAAADYNAAIADPLRQRIAQLMDDARDHDEKVARALSRADVEAERAGDALNERDKALEALHVCQRVLAAMVAPEAIKQTTVAAAWAQAVEAETLARKTLAEFKGGADPYT